MLSKQTKEKLGVEAKIIKSSIDYATHSLLTSDGGAYIFNLKSELNNIRITIIERDGTVSFDTDAVISKLDNHKDRLEFKQALENGEGSAVRYSKSLDYNTYYHAIMLKDGSILRVSREANSIQLAILEFLPVLLGISIFVCLICLILSKSLTRRLIAPIVMIGEDLDSVSEHEVYKEINPFIKKINIQNKQIAEQICRLEREKDEIFKAAQIRRDFAANVSHELKTPLTSIKGYSELILNDMVRQEDVKSFAEKITNESNRLVALIENIMRVSQVEEGTELYKEYFDLYALGQQVVKSLDYTAKQKGIALELVGEKVELNGNKLMIEELLYNLCDNGIKYNKDHGKVIIRIGAIEEMVKIEVEDWGIGIEKQYQDRIFERFYRIDKSRSKQTGGTGLGLSIVKHIVEYHNGEIQIESTVGKGTKVVVTLK